MIYVVRAGEHGRLFSEFQKKNVVAIGWNSVGDLSNVSSLNEIKALLRKAFPRHVLIPNLEVR